MDGIYSFHLYLPYNYCLSELLMRPHPPTRLEMGTCHKIRNNIKNKILHSTDKLTESEGEWKARCQDGIPGKLWTQSGDQS